MKRQRDSDELAARLMGAATTPLQVIATTPESGSAPAAVPNKRGRAKVDTVGMTLRPATQLYVRYVAAAAERTQQMGRVVSAQEIMLEVLERGAP